MSQSKRPRRHTSSRSLSSQKRRAVISGEEEEDERSTLNAGRNWFFQQSPMAQIYYLKVAIGLIVGSVVGVFYTNHYVAGNWFIFPLISLGIVIVIVRNYLKISKDDVDDFRLIAWHGTVSLIIGFIVASVMTDMILYTPHIVV